MSDDETGVSTGTTGGPDNQDDERRSRKWVVPLVLVLLAALPVAGIAVALSGGGESEAEAEDDDDGDERVAQEQDEMLANAAVTICEELDGEGGIAERDRFDEIVHDFSRPSDLRRSVRAECGDTYAALLASARDELDLTEERAVGDNRPDEVPDEALEESREVVAPHVFGFYFDEMRDGFAMAIESSGEVESVDVMAYDVETETVRVAVSSVYSTEDRLRSVAWDIGRAMTLAAFDRSEGFWGSLDYDVTWRPDFQLDVNGVAYRCTGETMARIADRSISRSEWEAACA